MNKHPHRYEEPRTPEELDVDRLSELEKHEYTLIRALRAGGIGTSFQAGHHVAMTDRCLCRESLPLNPDYPDLTRPRIRRFSLYCPLHDVELSVRAALIPEPDC